MKDHCGDEPKAKAFNLASTQDSEPLDKARKGRKRKQHKDRQDSTNPATNPATRVNKAKVNSRKKKDISKITCYNCNKKRYFATKCLEPWKSKN